MRYGIVMLRGYGKKAWTAPPSGAAKRIGVLIPARNEEGVIRDSVSTLLRQDYPREQYDVIVLANNCTDRTAELAAAAGARVLTPDVPTRSKGEVLRFAFSALKDAGYDLYCIFDADNLVDAGYLSAVNRTFCAGAQVAQGFRDSKNPTDSIFSGWCSIFYWFMSRLYNETRAALGESCAINGTGFAVSAELIDTIGFDPCSLTEDLEFSSQCALHDVKIHYMPDALTYDEQPLTLKTCYTQLRRWTGGAAQCQKRHGRQLLSKGTFSATDMLISFSGGPLIILGLLTSLCGFGWMAALLLADQVTPALALGLNAAGMLASLLALQAGAATICRAMRKPIRPMLPAILTFPGYALLSFLAGAVTQLAGPPARWIPVAHGLRRDPANGRAYRRQRSRDLRCRTRKAIR